MSDHNDQPSGDELLLTRKAYTENDNEHDLVGGPLAVLESDPGELIW